MTLKQMRYTIAVARYQPEETADLIGCGVSIRKQGSPGNLIKPQKPGFLCLVGNRVLYMPPFPAAGVFIFQCGCNK